jgi:hypothetical protein
MYSRSSNGMMITTTASSCTPTRVPSNAPRRPTRLLDDAYTLVLSLDLFQAGQEVRVGEQVVPSKLVVVVIVKRHGRVDRLLRVGVWLYRYHHFWRLRYVDGLVVGIVDHVVVRSSRNIRSFKDPPRDRRGWVCRP